LRRQSSGRGTDRLGNILPMLPTPRGHRGHHRLKRQPIFGS
jgi:hypothetical protein